MPVPTEDETVPDDLTIAVAHFDLSEIPPPPPEETSGPAIFFAYDQAPEIIGGATALRRHLVYPSAAARGNVEGIVYVRVIVGLNGTTEHAEVVKARPANLGFEESAVRALKKIKWKPAKQRDRDIRVWVTIPVQFQIRG